MMPPDASKLFDQEILRLKHVLSMGKSKLTERMSVRDSLKTENSHLNAAYIQSQHTLKERQSTLYGLEGRESELAVKVVGLDHLREQIRVNSLYV